VNRIVLTGASGFVGRHVLQRLLARDLEVHAVARSPRPDGESVTWHEVDLLDATKVARLMQDIRPYALLHLAWYAEHGKFWSARENLDSAAATLELVRAFEQAGGRRVVLAGTCAEYDWSGDCCSAETPLRPSSLYGVAKGAVRELVSAYASSVGLSWAWGRIFFPYGPGEHPDRVIANAARRLGLGQEVPCSPGDQVRDFLYVHDVAEAFAKLVESEATGVFDVGSGRGVRLKDVLLRLQELAGRDGLITFSETLRRDEPARIVAEDRRLETEVGWRPAYDLDRGLTETLAWWADRYPDR
jgi:nucleoside-diphosphate-sugar epimerase